MSDLISRKHLLNWLRNYQFENFAEVGHERQYNFMENLIKGVENEPTVEAVPVVHGEWIKNNKGIFICSKCNNGYKQQPTCLGEPMFHFCPVCGSYMRKKVE